MTKVFTIILLFFIDQTFCQEIDDANTQKVYKEVYGKCFNELNPIEEARGIISLKNVSFCRLYQCVAGVEYTAEEKDIQEAILKRAIEITTLLYNQGTPVYLLTGMNSSANALVENQNLKDDNDLIYVAIAECITSTSLEKIKDAVNKQTLKLINKK